jgi:arylformamidase
MTDSPKRRLIDVSHTVEHGMVTYKGFPAPIICDWMSREASRTKYAHGTEFQIGKIELLANTGTYIDSPFHRYAYFDGHPYLTARAADWLVKAGAALVGIDSLNIDSTATGERPVHTTLLGREIPIVEHMRGLAAAPDSGGRFTAVPVKVKGMGTFPVRAFVSAPGHSRHLTPDTETGSPPAARHGSHAGL